VTRQVLRVFFLFVYKKNKNSSQHRFLWLFFCFVDFSHFKLVFLLVFRKALLKMRARVWFETWLSAFVVVFSTCIFLEPFRFLVRCIQLAHPFVC